VADIIMPPIGVVLGGVNFSDLAFTLQEASKTAAGVNVPAVVIGYGKFIQTLLDFTIIAAAIFLMIKILSSFKKKAEAAAPAAPTATETLLTEIRDLLKK
jgi:large conductance mechanosensitive channel